ncbi:MAG TPA: hypothetical protein VN222_13510, partial [Novosphingobium sp.]|nr:hypothetical protein [Novosphingobium sp.]
VVGGFVKGGDIAVGPGDRAPARTAQEERLAPAASPPPPPPSRPAPAEGDDSPAAITPPPGRGLVIFYRPATLSWSGFGCSVKENGRKISSLGSGRWFAMSAVPGRHIFRVTAETSDELRMEVEEGEVHYVACRMKMGPLVARPFIRPVNAEDLRGAGKLKPVDVTDMGDEGPEGGAMKTLGRARGEAMVPAGAARP